MVELTPGRLLIRTVRKLSGEDKRYIVLLKKLKSSKSNNDQLWLVYEVEYDTECRFWLNPYYELEAPSSSG